MNFKKSLAGSIAMLLLLTAINQLFTTPPPDPVGVVQSVVIKTKNTTHPEQTITDSNAGAGFAVGLMFGRPLMGALIGATQQHQKVIPAYSETVTSCEIKVSVNNGKIYESFNYQSSLGRYFGPAHENVEKCKTIKQGETFNFDWRQPGHTTHFEYKGVWFIEE